jgi:uncharacterized protein (DUF697 family)
MRDCQEGKEMTKDENADAIIAAMTAGTTAIAIMPPLVDLAAFAAAIAGSVVAIAGCYDISITKGDAVELIMVCIGFGGTAFTGGKLISGFLKFTGLGYAFGGFIDAALYSTMSFAIGVTAKRYYRDNIRDPSKLKEIYKNAKRR